MAFASCPRRNHSRRATSLVATTGDFNASISPLTVAKSTFTFFVFTPFGAIRKILPVVWSRN